MKVEEVIQTYTAMGYDVEHLSMDGYMRKYPQDPIDLSFIVLVKGDILVFRGVPRDISQETAKMIVHLLHEEYS